MSREGGEKKFPGRGKVGESYRKLCKKTKENSQKVDVSSALKNQGNFSKTHRFWPLKFDNCLTLLNFREGVDLGDLRNLLLGALWEASGRGTF